MIKINLLPKKKKAVSVSRELVIGITALGLLYGAGTLWSYQLSSKIKNLKSQIDETKRQIESSRVQVEKISQLKTDKQALEKKLNVIKELKSKQRGPSPLLAEISWVIPKEIWLASLTAKGTRLELEGMSLTTNNVANFMKSLENTKILTQIELDRTAQETVTDKKIQKFKITCNLVN